MWVLRRTPMNSTICKDRSSWKGCLHADPMGKAWWATGLAKPTLFETKKQAEDYATTIRIDFPRSEIQVDIYEEEASF